MRKHLFWLITLILAVSGTAWGIQVIPIDSLPDKGSTISGSDNMPLSHAGKVGRATIAQILALGSGTLAGNAVGDINMGSYAFKFGGVAVSANGKSLITAANYAAMKTLMGYYTSYTDVLGGWTGTKDSSHCLAGDGTMQSCSGGGGSGTVTSSGTPTNHQWPGWTTSTNLAGFTVTASKPVCTNSSGDPAVCAGTEGIWLPAGGTAANATNAANIATTQTTTSANFFPLIVASSTNGNQVPYLITGWYVNPSTGAFTFPGTITASSFVSSATDGTRYSYTVNTADPTFSSPTPAEGMYAWNLTTHRPKWHNGTNWTTDIGAFVSDIPTAYGSTPAMDGSGNAGSSANFAKGDHVHPSDTTRALKVATGTYDFTGQTINSGVCTSALDGGTATGVVTTDVIDWGFSGDPTGVTGFAPTVNGMLTIIVYPTADHVKIKICNNTAGNITTNTTVTLNWAVRR